MTFNEVNDIIRSLGQRDGLSNLQLDTNGCTGISLADGVLVYLELNPQHEMLYLYSPLTEISAQQEQLTANCMAMLRFSCLNAGLTVFMHPKSEGFCIQFSLPVTHLTVADLDKSLDLLTAGRRALLQQLPQHSVQNASPAQRIPSQLAGDIRRREIAG